MSLPRLRASKEHGQILAVPPLHKVASLLQGNRRTLVSASLSLLGKSLDELRTLARREILVASTQYHRAAEEFTKAVKADAASNGRIAASTRAAS